VLSPRSQLLLLQLSSCSSSRAPKKTDRRSDVLTIPPPPLMSMLLNIYIYDGKQPDLFNSSSITTTSLCFSCPMIQMALSCQRLQDANVPSYSPDDFRDV
jgi:hypothetical protein